MNHSRKYSFELPTRIEFGVGVIETLAERIATAVLEGWPVHMVRITVHKPQAPIPVPFDDVTVSVTRVRIEGAL